jgi:hypothetical protein
MPVEHVSAKLTINPLFKILSSQNNLNGKNNIYETNEDYSVSKISKWSIAIQSANHQRF